MKKNFNSVVRLMAEAAGYLWEKGWAERNGGNISIMFQSSRNSLRVFLRFRLNWMGESTYLRLQAHCCW
mgnify:CR=1 FL=1